MMTNMERAQMEADLVKTGVTPDQAREMVDAATQAFDPQPVGDVLRFAGKLYHWTRSPAGNLMTVPVFDDEGKRVLA